MAGFASIVGFIFAFFTLVLIFSSIFVIYNKQLFEQISLLESRGSEYTDSTLYNYNIKNTYYGSGRLLLELENQGNALKFLEKNFLCFSFFYDDLFFAKDKLKITVPGHLPDIYSIIEKGTTGYAHLRTQKDTTKTHNIKAISCGGIENYESILPNKQNWWNENWNQRDYILVENQATKSIVEYQVLVQLNTSTFDFNLGREEEIRFLVPLDQFLVIDLTFDSYSQNLNEYSRYSNSAILGTTTATQSSDPQKLDSAVLFSGLSFDGAVDLITISDDNSLDLDEEITYSMWLKWARSGDSYQTLIRGSEANNYLRIVNNGGGNDDTLEFSLEINKTQKILFSNQTLDSNWHFVTATYDGSELELYIDSVKVGNTTAYGNITTGVLDTLIGVNSSNNYFNGSLDEFKTYNIALSQTEIQELYEARLKFRELDYYLRTWSGAQESAEAYVKIPYLGVGQNVSFELYYDNRKTSLLTNSNIESTFSYQAPRLIGYVVSDRISGTTGLNILSLYDNNTIFINEDIFNLNEQGGATHPIADISSSDDVKMKYLSQVEGNGNGDDMIVPISWASQEFIFRGFRAVTDRFCLLSPFGIANYTIYDAGVLQKNGTVSSTTSCFNLNIGTSNNLRINSTLPILVHYTGNGQDSFPFFGATDEDLFGVPSRTLYIATGINGASTTRYESDGSSTVSVLGSLGTISDGGNGAGDGDANAFRIESDNPIGAIQEADGDGSEATVFLPQREFGVKFGSNEATDYVAVASNIGDANCSVYDSSNVLIENVPLGIGVNGVYKYNFGTGNDILYATARWKMECDKPVYAYYENRADNGDETNMFGHMQMRQYIYPKPTVSYLG